MSGSADQRRAPGLDAIRAAAIALVLAHHFRHLPGAPEGLRWFGLRGYVGVDLFFVLSGWLIGGQLWRELGRTGTIDRWRFWKRRWWRTLPSYLAMLVLLVAVGRLAPSDLPAMALFLQNYLAPGVWLATWSLCIEEQFYLALPLVAPLVLRARKISRPAAVAAAVGLIGLSPLLRALAFAQLAAGSYDDFLNGFYAPTHLRLEGLALGVAMAALAAWRTPLWQTLERRAGLAGVIGALLVASQWLPLLTGATADPRERLGFYNAVPGFFVVSLGVAFLLPWATSWRAPRIVARLLAVVADHAYALYLTHELARDAVTQALAGRTLPFALWLVLVVLASALLAAGLRAGVERRGLGWRAATSPRAG